MYTTSSGLKYKTYKKNDPGFNFSPDNIVIVPRAGFEFGDGCPREYQLIIAECINNGWIKPIAYQPVHEHFMEELTK
jgi:hypothetical protein